MYNSIAKANYIFFKNIHNVQAFLDKYLILSESLKKLISHKKRRNNSKNNYTKRVYDSTNIITSDTENTSLYVKRKNGEKAPFAFSYAQMINLNSKITIITRDIIEYKELLNEIDNWYDIKGLKSIKGFTAVIWFHNLSYDFQFLINVANISETLSRKKHDVIYAIDADRCFQYKDSYSLLGVSLDSATKDYNVSHKKLVGQLNYSLKRLPITSVTNEEIAYFINDVQGLGEIIQILMNTNGYGKKNDEFIGYKNFPNTKTGLVRDYISNVIVEKGLEKTRERIIKKIFTSSQMYSYLKRAYQGGYTHAFGYTKGKIIQYVTSYDKTSDYPYQIVTKKYPMSEFEEVKEKQFLYDFDKGFDDSAYIITVTLKDVKANSFVTIIPYRKFEKTIVNGKQDNGKLYACDEITLTCTELDFMQILQLYEIKNVEFHSFYRATKDYLPYWILKAVFEFYKKKTVLKGVAGKEIEYQYFKQLLNSVYGCMVQDPCKTSFSFSDGNWSEIITESDEEIENAVNGGKKKSNVYQWGVWVTAYARYELINVASKLDDTDLVYCDTDSLKFKIKDEYTKLFNTLNKEMSDDNKRVAKALHELYPDISYADFTPKNQKGKVQELGLWDNEGEYLYFKTTGAKRYVYIELNKDNEMVLHVTCCGIAKEKMAYQLILQSSLNHIKSDDKDNKGYIIKTKKDVLTVLNKFDQDFHVDAENDENGNSITGKSIHTYFGKENKDRVKSATITDYQGKKQKIKCLNYITLFPAEFTFNANRDEIDYLIAERNR